MMEMEDELLTEALQNNKGKRDVLESDNNERQSSETSRESREQLQQKKQSMEDELCLVFYIFLCKVTCNRRGTLSQLQGVTLPLQAVTSLVTSSDVTSYLVTSPLSLLQLLCLLQATLQAL